MAEGAHASSMKTPWFSDQLYNVLKYFAQIILPALATLYAALGLIWGLPKSEQVVATIVALDTFLGVVLQLAAKSYNESDTKYDGVMELEQTEDGGKRYSLSLNVHPDRLDEKDAILFRVAK